ncbi:MAG TPA: transglycosylase SLT domain-containing protein [Luteimonas sp.]|nr:transglycosylase SLT domain-containing protein [Luteimonas sp.]
MRRPRACRLLAALVGALALQGANAGSPAPLPGVDPALATPAPTAATSPATPATRNGREIYARFREGLADPTCDPEDTSQRWQHHFAAAPKRLASRDDDVLPLFGYVVEAMRQAQLPTEFALIPFVESGYKPGARSGAGPAGLWQFIALTARNHKVPIRPGYDGRLSPVESTQAAVRYLRTLHGMFAGDWRLAVMAYNAGEYRVLGALRRSGQRAMEADPDKLVGVSGITRAYVRKLHALSCVLDRADDREEWMRALDRPVAVLAPATLPQGVGSLDKWAGRNGVDPALLKRINPAFPGGRVASSGRALQVLAPAGPAAIASAPTAAPAAPGPTTLADASGATTIIESPAPAPAAPLRSHTVVRGDSIWRLAKRYGVSRGDLLARNGLSREAVLRPGMVLRIDAGPDADAEVATTGAPPAVPE